jgi:hypothetical protein
MKYVILILMLFAFAVPALAQDNTEVVVERVAVECNWGRLTMESIQGGFPQGPHSADPSGDGKGKGNADQPRAGLANVIEQGNLQLTCEFIQSLLDD